MFGNNLIHLSEVDSTNNFIAKLILEQNVPFGTVILADYQLKGKGQRGNNWTNSGVKQFAASYYVDTAFLSVEDFVYFNFAIALSVRETIASFVNDDVCIKWPNDVFVKNQKIAGILIETNLKNHKIPFAIVGIGINLNPVDGIAHATSLNEKSEVNLDAKQVLYRLNAYLNHHYAFLKRGELNAIKNEYESCLWRKNEQIPMLIKSSGEQFNGKIVGVNTNGNLMVERDHQELEFRNQELSFELNYDTGN
jgi:BirA family biotin operon repressor/biotin-[acetyl-CoA-carboxylase] ligase